MAACSSEGSVEAGHNIVNNRALIASHDFSQAWKSFNVNVVFEEIVYLSIA
jgi:hypothetical protein